MGRSERCPWAGRASFRLPSDLPGDVPVGRPRGTPLRGPLRGADGRPSPVGRGPPLLRRAPLDGPDGLPDLGDGDGLGLPCPDSLLALLVLGLGDGRPRAGPLRLPPLRSPCAISSKSIPLNGKSHAVNVALSQWIPAATYSPTQLPRQYHRRWRA